jgi:hypothetical protein
MKKTVLFALMLALSAAGSVPAVAADTWNLSDWLKRLEAKVRNTEQKQKNQLAAAVAIRGDKKDDEAKQLYWKGKKGRGAASPEEVAAFKSALDLAQAGKSDESRESFDSFLRKYPDSPLAPDAKQTLALLKGESAAPPAEETPPTPAAPAEVIAPAAEPAK